MTYPQGAGPYGGQFAGDVYVPPAVAVAADPASAVVRSQIATKTAVAEAGVMRARFTPSPNAAWLVRRITVQSNTAGRAYVYVGDPIPDNIVSGTVSGEFDENDANQPYLVPEGVALVIEWPSGGVCRARIEYDEV